MTPEMRAFEYALGLFSVLIGLAIADIATSFHRLIRSRAGVTWWTVPDGWPASPSSGFS